MSNSATTASGTTNISNSGGGLSSSSSSSPFKFETHVSDLEKQRKGGSTNTSQEEQEDWNEYLSRQKRKNAELKKSGGAESDNDAMSTRSMTSLSSSSSGSNSKNALVLLKRLSPTVNVLKRVSNGEIFVRYTVSKELRWMAVKMIESTQAASRHPSILMGLLAVKRRDGSIECDTEYADAGPLVLYLPFFPIAVRCAVAKSVARQVLTGLFYFDVVHDRQHRNVCPTTVYLRRDGCVKLGFFDLIDKSVLEIWPDWYLNSPYCAPEYRQNPAARLKSESKADVWALGALIVAILLGKTLQPKVSKRKPAAGNDANSTTSGEASSSSTRTQAAAGGAEETSGDTTMQTSNPTGTTSAPTEAQQKAYQEEQRVFEELIIKGTDPMWRMLIPDDALRHLARRCLRVKVEARASLAEACALTYLLGGVQEDDKESLKKQEEALKEWRTQQKQRDGEQKAELASKAVSASASTSSNSSSTSASTSAVAAQIPKAMFELDPAEYPDPFVTQASALSAFDGKAGEEIVSSLESAGEPIKAELAQKFDLYDESEGEEGGEEGKAANEARAKSLNGSVGTNAEIYMRDKAAETLRNLSILLHLELQSWRKARSDSSKRAKVDKFMREISKDRLKLAWKTMAKCIQDARTVISKASQASHQQQQKQQAEGDSTS